MSVMEFVDYLQRHPATAELADELAVILRWPPAVGASAPPFVRPASN
jgi:hypothetical protein